jgi:hypothetical protein
MKRILLCLDKWATIIYGILIAIVLLFVVANSVSAAIINTHKPIVKQSVPRTPVIMLQYRAALTREAQFVYGINAPIPMFAGQIWQESGGKANAKAWDLGMGLGQFEPGTAKEIVKLYPELGPSDPFNPVWSIRALVRYDDWIYKRVKGVNACEVWGGSLDGYNAGLGYVQKAQRASPDPTVWFTKTEYVPTGQTAKNKEYSRVYPRIILFKHQAMFSTWGALTCLPYVPVGKNSF